MKKIMFNDRYGLTKAVLEGRKTMTRRIIKPQPIEFLCVEKSPNRYMEIIQEDDLALRIKSHYKVGEVVAVAQNYNSFYDDTYNPVLFPAGAGWDNKMFVKAELMPHQIRITGIRCERLQDISDEECLREGVGVSATDNLVGFPIAIPFNYYIGRDEKGYRYVTPREAFSVLIDKVSGRGTWQSNPYVWVYEFELLN